MGWESLSFEERQKQWTGMPRTFRQNNGRGDRPSVWEIRVDGSRVSTKHGLLGGAMQETDYVGKAKNVGKVNEITPQTDAIAEARRDVRKKWDFEGYDEYIGETNIDHRNQDVSVQHLLTALPGSFCLYKPENTAEDQKKLWAKAQKGEALYTLKRDGIAKLIVVDYYSNVVIYSRRARPYQDKEGPKELPDGTLDFSTVVPWSARFPHLVEAVKRLQLPPGTMMAAELVTGPDRAGDNFPYVSGLTKGYTARAIEDMKKDGLPWLYWWDVPFYAGEDLVSTKPVRERHTLIQHHTLIGGMNLPIQPIQTVKFGSPEEAVASAKQHGLEGWVVVDPDAIYGDKGWNLKGKPDRPSTIAKLKPDYEDDFIAVWDPDKKEHGEWGTGKHEKGKIVTLPDGSTTKHGGVGALGLYQYNSAGELVYISKVASGMDYAFQAKLKASDFPMVVEVQYKGRTYMSEDEKTNALRHPTFLRVREDKRPEECVNARL